jgi:hypothetical protein
MQKHFELVDISSLDLASTPVIGVEALGQAGRSLCMGAEMTTTARKGSRYYRCGMGSWREGGELRNVHLGNSATMEEPARQKAKKIKTEALSIDCKFFNSILNSSQRKL